MLFNYNFGTQPNQNWNPLTGRALGPGMGPSQQAQPWTPNITPVGNQNWGGGSPVFDESGGQGRPATPSNVQNWTPFGQSRAPDWRSFMVGAAPGGGGGGGGGGFGSAVGAPYQFPAMTYPTPGNNFIGGGGGGGRGGPDLFGSASNWTPQYGGIPNVANPLAGQQMAIQGNLSNFPAISQLAGEINPLQQGQLLANYEQAFPGFGARMAEGSEGIRTNLAGEISEGSRRQMAIGAAERGLAGGQAGASPLTNAGYLAALGRTAEGQAALGQQQLNARIAATPVVQPYDITREMLTGAQLTDAANMANLYASAPVPTLAAAEQQRIADEAMSRGMAAQDWLAQRNYGRSAEQTALDRQQALAQLGYGAQLSDWEQQRAWERAMAQLASQREPQQNLPWAMPNIYAYNNRGNPSEFYSDISFQGGPPGTVGGPTTKGLLTPEETRRAYEAWYGGAGAQAVAAARAADPYGLYNPSMQGGTRTGYSQLDEGGPVTYYGGPQGQFTWPPEDYFGS